MSTEVANIMDLAKGLQQSAAAADDGASSFMKFTKYGDWVWGTEDTETEEASLWLVHPQGFKHGYIAWGDKAHDNYGEKLGEISIPATEPLPLESSLVEVAGNWAKQISMQLMCIEGMDEGVRVTFNSNSVGGRKAYAKVVNEVITKIKSGDDAMCPVVKLSSDSYVHPKYKKIFTPVIEIVDWKTLAELNATLDASAIEDKSDEPKEATQAEANEATKADTTEVKEPEPEPEAKAEGAVRTRRVRRHRGDTAKD